MRQLIKSLYFRFLTVQSDGAEWIILCDGLTGAIVQTQRLVDIYYD